MVKFPKWIFGLRKYNVSIVSPSYLQILHLQIQPATDEKYLKKNSGKLIPKQYNMIAIYMTFTLYLVL